jgi:hypothetical protein
MCSTCINHLRNKVNNLLKEDLSSKKDPFSLLYKQSSNKKILLNKYPMLDFLMKSLDADYLNNKAYLSLGPIVYSGKIIVNNEEIIRLITNHNSKIIRPKLNEYLKEKEAFLLYRGYNTPSSNDLTVTPLVGTGIINFEGLNSKDYISIYNQ